MQEFVEVGVGADLIWRLYAFSGAAALGKFSRDVGHSRKLFVLFENRLLDCECAGGGEAPCGLHGPCYKLFSSFGRSLSILLCVRQKALLNEAGCMRGETRYGFNAELHESMMRVAKGQADNMIFGILFVSSYVYLFRLPSEALPLMVRTGSCNVNVDGDEVVITLQTRNNIPGGSRLAREAGQ